MPANEVSQVLLEPRAVGDIHGEFVVPSYQRGYRWGEPEVRRLLDDVYAAGDHPYYLQPVVVLPRGDDRWDVVDGQQRLTTLHLLQRYIHDEILPSAAPRYTMNYETRPDSHEYLSTLDPQRRLENIDFFHMRAAYDCISKWFEAHEHRKISVALKIYERLSESVKVIWFEADTDVDPITLFTRLNVGRIPLTDAELVKAVLLSRSRREPADRSLEVAAQWDEVERDLRDPEVWAFVSGRDQDVPTHISLLLDTLAGGPSDHRTPYLTFETLRPSLEEDPLGFWERVLDLHALVMGWYAARDLFHLVGFLVATGTDFGDLVTLAAGRTKSELRERLVTRVRERLNLDEARLRDLGYTSKRTETALLLLNVETVRSAKTSTERYSFRAHAAREWSLEHIHAQNAEPLTRVDQWRTWLDLHAMVIQDHPGLDAPARDTLLQRIEAAGDDLTRAGFRLLERDVLALLAPPGVTNQDEVDSIANLALLSSGDNIALSNSVFEVKRREVLRRDREGSYLPACTRNVFLKYYTQSASQQTYFWGPQDRSDYMEAIIDALQPYLTGVPR